MSWQILKFWSCEKKTRAICTTGMWVWKEGLFPVKILLKCDVVICDPVLCIFIPHHTKGGRVLCYTLRTLSVYPSVGRPSIRLSISASFPCSNFSTFWPIFFKLCIDIGTGEEWYGIASGLISFWNNRVMALDVCQKCFALLFSTLTIVPFYWFSSNFA